MKLNQIVGLAVVIIALLGIAAIATGGNSTISHALNNQTMMTCGACGLLLLMRCNRHERREKQ